MIASLHASYPAFRLVIKCDMREREVNVFLTSLKRVKWD